ncbi:MAG: ATP-binding protein, partial [Chloroflexi bacterium]|nr:ATP-binding protein [Chloroflexota bacterium]
MKNNDDFKNKIELAGLKDYRGLNELARYAPLLKKASFIERINRVLDLRANFAPNPHPFASPDNDMLPMGDIPFVRVVRMDGTLGPWVPLPTGVVGRHPHMLIAGPAGTGKSWTVCYTVQNFALSGFGCLLLDTEGEYSNLMLYLPDGLCWVFDDMTFKRNPLQPLPGEERRRTYGRVKRIFRETFLRDGSVNLLGEELVNSVDAAGQVATLRRLLEQLGRARYRLDSRRGQYLESLKNRLSNVVEFVDIFDCVEGFDIRDWLGPRCMVLRLTALSDELKDFVVNDLVATIQDWTQENPSLGLKLVIAIDEAHRFFAPGKAARYDLGDPILLDAARTLRKRGVNLILSTQVFRDLPVAALANISTFLIFR